MAARTFAFRWRVALAVATGVLNASSIALAQGGAGGGMASAGVVIDADGVLTRQVVGDPTGELVQQRILAARAALDRQIAQKSEMRKVSLNRLEKAISDQLANGRQPTEPMKFLAGLTRIQYVFYYPDTKDIVIAGPAEGWFPDLNGRYIGMHSGRPVIELQDLVTALRANPPGQEKNQVIGCSIDPTPEGLAKMQQFLQTVGKDLGGPPTQEQTDFITNGLRTSLGMQKVRISGVSPQTHFGQVMVEADYRMKLIGMGVEQPPVRIISWIEKADPAGASRNALQRWFFIPDYKCVRVSEDRMAMEMVGQGVKLVGEGELVTNDGQRKVQGNTGSKASDIFVKSFTQKYADLAARSPVYAQLRNLIDLAVAARFIQQQDYYGQAGWRAEILMNEDKIPVLTYQTPLYVEPVVSAIMRGSRLMTPIGGGVRIETGRALATENLLPDDGGKVQKFRQEVNVKNLGADQWWWD
jgi:hypothetical protein